MKQYLSLVLAGLLAGLAVAGPPIGDPDTVIKCPDWLDKYKTWHAQNRVAKNATYLVSSVALLLVKLLYQ